MKVRAVFCGVALCASGWVLAQISPAPYAGEQARSIKALSDSQVDDLLAGRGIGLARAAELNGYPGPMHVLDLAAELALGDSQIAETRRIHSRMQTEARDVGARLVAAEAELDCAFRRRAIDQRSLEASLERIALLQGRLRAAHLAAHIEQARLLSDEQIARYAALRGYAGEGVGDGGHGNDHRGHH